MIGPFGPVELRSDLRQARCSGLAERHLATKRMYHLCLSPAYDESSKSAESAALGVSTVSERKWEIFSFEELSARVEGKEPAIYEFIRSSALSCMVYRLPAGSNDMQAPHLEDEVYFVVSGRAKMRIAGQEREVRPGNILFIRSTLDHSFFDIEEDLTVIAVFGAQVRR